MAILLAVLMIYIQIWDYLTTVYAYQVKAAYELNPTARSLLENGDFVTLAYQKALFILFTLLVFLLGVYLYGLGLRSDNDALKSIGVVLISVFAFIYVAMLIILTLNFTSITSG